MSRTPGDPDFVEPEELTGDRAHWHSGAVEHKARRLLANGRVRISESDSTHVVATVEGDRGNYAVRFSDGKWSCGCASGRDGQLCSHQAAVQMTVAPS